MSDPITVGENVPDRTMLEFVTVAGTVVATCIVADKKCSVSLPMKCGDRNGFSFVRRSTDPPMTTMSVVLWQAVDVVNDKQRRRAVRP